MQEETSDVPNSGTLKTCFIESLSLSDDVDLENLVYRGVQQWDSLSHMHLITALETQFDIMIDTEDVLDMSSFRKAAEILQKYGVEFDSDGGE